MTIQPITHRGRTVAAATRTRFFLAEALEQRPDRDPERTFVVFMCAYAGDVLSGMLPGPYTDDDARRYARACLVPLELLERTELDVDLTAGALQIPADELSIARAELALCGDGEARHCTEPLAAWSGIPPCPSRTHPPRS